MPDATPTPGHLLDGAVSVPALPVPQGPAPGAPSTRHTFEEAELDQARVDLVDLVDARCRLMDATAELAVARGDRDAALAEARSYARGRDQARDERDDVRRRLIAAHHDLRRLAAPVPAAPAPEPDGLRDRLVAAIETALNPSPDVTGCPGSVAALAADAALAVIADPGVPGRSPADRVTDAMAAGAAAGLAAISPGRARDPHATVPPEAYDHRHPDHQSQTEVADADGRVDQTAEGDGEDAWASLDRAVRSVIRQALGIPTVKDGRNRQWACVHCHREIHHDGRRWRHADQSAAGPGGCTEATSS